MRPMNQTSTKFDVFQFNQYEYNNLNIKKVSKLIKINLSPSLISRDIRKKYPDIHLKWKRALFGYCVPASFALLFFMNTNRLHPFTGSDPDGENHWWLEDLITSEKFDLTSVQYSKEELAFVYSTGRPKRLYSFQGRPQKRFLDLMLSVQPSGKRYFTYKTPFS